MTILQSLAALYDRLDRRGQRDGLAIVPPPGLKFAEIDFILELSLDGRPFALKSKIPANGRRGPKLMVPGTSFNPKPKPGEAVWDDLSFRNRTSGRRSYLFWDKTSYVFGVAAKKKVKGAKSAGIEFEITDKSRADQATFANAHRQLLAEHDDPEFTALLRFLDTWTPEAWSAAGFPLEALDKNIGFQVAGAATRIDQKPEARTLAADVVASRTAPRRCLLTDEVRPYAASHPQFKGVRGAQSSGASLVSFNRDSFESYEQDKAATAPISDAAAFRYGAALNWLLDRDNARAFRLGETTVVFWADDKSTAGGEATAKAVEDALAAEFGDPFSAAGDYALEDETDGERDSDDADADDRDIDAEQEAAMRRQAVGVRTLSAAPDPGTLDLGTCLHILGLSPNSGRIAVRFWLVDTWGHLADNIAKHQAAMKIEPEDFTSNRKPYALLYETAVLRKAENIPPRLSGELARTVLSGGRYPQTLFTSVISRIRADKTINAARVGVCKAVINRDIDISGGPQEEKISMALDPANTNPAYRLGRLFALIEGAQKAALPGIKATVKDRFFGAACSTPARVFPLLHKNAMNHIASVRKERGSGLAHWMEKEIGAVWAGLSDDLPRALRLEEQGRFIAGYYHQRFSKTADAPAEAHQIMASDNEDTEQ